MKVPNFVSVILPVYNEQETLPILWERLQLLFKRKSDIIPEFLFLDNASTDGTRAFLLALVKKYPEVRIFCMSRNFGTSQSSYLAGIHHARGEAVILMDTDLQDPPELIEKFLEEWGNGYKVVYGQRVKRKETIFRRVGYFLFYRLFKFLSYLDIPLDASEFCLMDRSVVEVIKSFPEKDILIRGMRCWAGFSHKAVPYVREKRYKGITSYSLAAYFYWAKKAIVNFSYKPLEYISRLAFASVCFTICFAIFYLHWYMTSSSSPRGFMTLLLSLCFFSSIQMLSLSVIAEYLIRIFHEVKKRPVYVIEEIWEHEDGSISEKVSATTSAHFPFSVGAGCVCGGGAVPKRKEESLSKVCQTKNSVRRQVV